MNKVILVGRLTRDPDVRYSSGDSAMAISRFTIAVDRRVRRSEGVDNGQQTADFIGCVAFGRQGEFVEKYLRKGTKVVLEGRIQTGSYEKDGKRVYTTDVVAENLEFAESRNAAGVSGGSDSFIPASNSQPHTEVSDGFMNIPDGIDEELPFN